MSDILRNPGKEYFEAFDEIVCLNCGKAMLPHDIFVVVHADTMSPKCEGKTDRPSKEKSVSAS